MSMIVFPLKKAKRILERAPEGATHYRDLSCGTRYTKNISETECYVWTNKGVVKRYGPSKNVKRLIEVAKNPPFVSNLDISKCCGNCVIN